MRKLMWFSICAVIAIAFVVAAPLAHADSLYCCQYCSRYANGTITCSPCMCGNQCIGVQGGCHGTVTLPKTDLPRVLECGPDLDARQADAGNSAGEAEARIVKN